MLTLFLSLVLTAPPPELAQAKEALRNVQYPQALKLPEKARAAAGTELETSCEIDELLGVVQATLKQPKPATESFKRLLAKKPNHTFAAPQAPRVMTPYFEARSWLKDTGPLAVEVSGLRRDGWVELSWTVRGDALALVSSLNVTLLEDDTPRRLRLKRNEALTVSSSARQLSVSTRALDAAEREVFVDEARRFDAPAPPVVPVVTPPPAPPLAPAVTTPLAAPPARSGLSPLRTTAFILAGLAAGSLVVGTIFGSQSAQARSEFDVALQDSSFFGRSPLSMTQARQLDARVQSTAWIANGSFIGAGVLGLAAVVLWFVGAP
jgi:hypothetical protein